MGAEHRMPASGSVQGAAAVTAEVPPPREYLAFLLGGEAYAIDILQVQEIRCLERVTRVAGVPPFIRGVTNLRGAIVPALDLRLRFGLPARGDTRFTVMIVLALQGRLAGVVVDSVEDVLAVTDDALLPAPALGSHVAASFVRGLACVEGQMYVVLDAQALVLAPESGLLGDVP